MLIAPVGIASIGWMAHRDDIAASAVSRLISRDEQRQALKWEATMALVGVHPVFTQVPPNNLRSTNATFMPEFASRFASGGPAWPAPTTIASNLVAMRCTFHEFKEHAAGALRMNKNIAMATSPDFDFFRDEPRSIFFQLGDSGRQIGNAKAASR